MATIPQDSWRAASESRAPAAARRVGTHRAAQDLEEGGFAGAVLPDDGVGLARPDLEAREGPASMYRLTNTLSKNSMATSRIGGGWTPMWRAFIDHRRPGLVKGKSRNTRHGRQRAQGWATTKKSVVE
jgi:hypothetical protein